MTTATQIENAWALKKRPRGRETRIVMGCSSNSGETKYSFSLTLSQDVVPISLASETDRPYVKLTISLTTDPNDSSFKKRIYLSSAGSSGKVTFDNDSPEVTSGTPFEVKVYGHTVSDAVDATKIEARLETTGEACEELDITVWKIKVTDDDSDLPENGYAYIDAAPSMPALRTYLKPDDLIGTVLWQAFIEYKRAPRNDESTLNGSAAADAMWNLQTAFGTNFYGGKCTLTATYAGIAKKFILYIRGTNPSTTDLHAEIGNSPWYAKAICFTESSNKQFNTGGTLGPEWSNFKACPNRSADMKGWGLYQITNPPHTVTINDLWGWKANIAHAKTIMADNRLLAQGWIDSQKTQQMADAPAKTLDKETFTYGTPATDFKEGTAKTPVDACAIEAFNGVTPGWAVWWDRTDKVWKNRDNSNNYIALVCSNL